MFSDDVHDGGYVHDGGCDGDGVCGVGGVGCGACSLGRGAEVVVSGFSSEAAGF